MFSGNFGIHEFQNENKPNCIIPILEVNNNNEDNYNVDLTTWFSTQKPYHVVHNTGSSTNTKTKKTNKQTNKQKNKIYIYK